VLYVPQYWWHQMEALTNNTSLSWWYKDTTRTSKAVTVDETGKTVIDTSVINLLAVRRNVENLITSSLPDSHYFFLALASGVLDFEPQPAAGEAAAEVEVDEAWVPLEADAAQADAVRARFNADWPAALQHALMMVRHLPFFEPLPKAKAFLRSLVAGRFNSFTVLSPEDHGA